MTKIAFGLSLRTPTSLVFPQSFSAAAEYSTGLFQIEKKTLISHIFAAYFSRNSVRFDVTAKARFISSLSEKETETLVLISLVVRCFTVLLNIIQHQAGTCQSLKPQKHNFSVEREPPKPALINRGHS